MTDCLRILTVSLSLLAATSRGTPTAEELLDKYTQALDSLRSIIVKTEVVTQHEYGFSEHYHEPGFRGVRDKGTVYKREEFRTDGQRIHTRQYTWGHISPLDPSVPEARPCYNCLNYAQGRLYSHNARVDPKLPGGSVHSNESPNFKLRGQMPGRGYDIQNDERLDSILRSAKTLSVRPGTATIGGSACYVIDARTDCGTISVWLDPAHGWHAARIEAKGRGADRSQGQAGGHLLGQAVAPGTGGQQLHGKRSLRTSRWTLGRQGARHVDEQLLRIRQLLQVEPSLQVD